MSDVLAGEKYGALYRIECPYCGGHELEENRCAYCDSILFTPEELQQLRFRQARKAPEECTPEDLDYYYYTYRPDRGRAVAALRMHTGLGPLDAVNKIDLIFDYYENEQHFGR